MDAVTTIQQNLDVERVLNHFRFDKMRYEGDVIRACCKIHGGNNASAFVINHESGLWYCHTGDCGGGDMFTLVQKMEGITFAESVHWLSDFLGINIDGMTIVERKTGYLNDLKKFITLMKSKKKTELQEYKIDANVREVVRYRNFNEDTLKYFNLGYVESITLHKQNGDEYTLYDRLVFPLVFKGVQVGMSLRKTKSNDYPKWFHQPVHIEASKMLYNHDALLHTDVITICEGITDVWAFHEINVPAVAIFGSHLSKEQYKLLMYSGADIVLAFDGDEAGRNATKKTIEMFRNKANIEVIYFDEGQDPASITREDLSLYYASRRKCNK